MTGGVHSADARRTVKGFRGDRSRRSYGGREGKAALEDFGVDLGDRYVNIQRVAKPWWKRTRSERPERRRGKKTYRSRGYSLEFFEKGLGLARPRHLANGLATKRLRNVRDSIERHEGDWSRLTPTAKGTWTKLLKYNETDVRNLARLARRVAGGVVRSGRL